MESRPFMQFAGNVNTGFLCSNCRLTYINNIELWAFSLKERLLFEFVWRFAGTSGHNRVTGFYI